MRAIHAVWAAAVLCAACGGGEKKAPAGPSGGGAPPGAAPSAPAEKPAPAAPAPAGKAALSSDKVKELAKTDVPGFKRVQESFDSSNARPSYEAEKENEKGVKLFATVDVGACLFCVENKLSEWTKPERIQNLKTQMARVHIDNPALVFEVYEIDLGDRKGIAVYKQSFVETKTSDGGTSRSSSHGLQVWWNDGVNQFFAEVSPRGAGAFVDSLDQLKASVSKEEFEKAGKAIFAAFAPALR